VIPIRVIPRLDIKGPNLVKGIHLEGSPKPQNPKTPKPLYAYLYKAYTMFIYINKNKLKC